MMAIHLPSLSSSSFRCVATTTLLLLLCILPHKCHGFGNLPQSVSDLFSQTKNNNNKKNSSKEEATTLLLKELGVESSTEPKVFSAPMAQIPSLLIASLPAVLRLGSGIFANGYQVSIVPKQKQPSSKYTVFSYGDYEIKETCISPGRTTQVQPLVLYEFEQCPFCRKVREAISILGLTVTFQPCPPKGRLYRRDIKAQYGPSATFPFLQDPNTGIELFESDAIIDYLFRTYGSNGSTIPWTLTNPILVPLTAGLSLLLGGGGTVRNSNPPPPTTTNDNNLMELWSYEGSPFCKVVKERLCELELAHTQISCPRGSPNRQLLFDQTGGRFQAPYLRDPTTGIELFESQAICEYLQKQYGVADSPIKYL